MQDSPLKLNLKDDVRRQIDIALSRRWQDAREGAKERDERLTDYLNLLAGKKMPVLQPPWPNSCQLVSPLVWENRTTLLANLAQPLRRDPMVLVRSRSNDGKASARGQEAWISDTWLTEGFKSVFYDYVSNLLRDDAAIIYGGWAEKIRQKRIIRYWDGESYDEAGKPFLLSAEERDPETPERYEAVPAIQHETERRGRQWRCVDLANFYLYPSNARSIQDAQMTFERMYLSENELLMGIKDFGYDKDAVMELIRMGPSRPSVAKSDTSAGDHRENSDAIQGVEAYTSEVSEGDYQCALFFGTLPKLWQDGESQLPDHLWYDNFVGMMSLDHPDIVFWLDFAPYHQFPYFGGSIDPTPNSAYGSGIVGKLETNAYEATALVRSTMDAIDWTIRPSIIMGDEDYEHNKGMSRSPGAIFRETIPGSIRPFPQDNSGLIGFQAVAYVEGQAKEIASSKSYGTVDAKVRRVAEIQNAMNAADLKFDLYQYNAYKVLTELAAWTVALEVQFNPDLQETIPTAKGEVSVSLQDLQGNFVYSVAQTSADSNPDARRQKTELVLEIQMGYFSKLAQFPDRAIQLWHAHRDALLDLDIRDPVEVLGEEPQPPAPPMPGAVPGMPGAPQGTLPGVMPGAIPMPQGGPPVG